MFISIKVTKTSERAEHFDMRVAKTAVNGDSAYVYINIWTLYV